MLHPLDRAAEFLAYDADAFLEEDNDRDVETTAGLIALFRDEAAQEIKKALWAYSVSCSDDALDVVDKVCA